MKRLLWILVPCGLISAVIAAGMMEMDLGPRPGIRVVQSISREGQQAYLLELVNPTRQDLEYWGYGAASPMYQMKTLEEGRWQDVTLGWCGMGAAPQRLAAHGGSQQFVVYVREAPSQVGLLLLPPNYERGHVHQFEWMPFPMRAKLVKWQNHRLDEKMAKNVVWSARLEPLPQATMLTTQASMTREKR